jgi:uncharacterized protein with HEPN domain
MVERIERIQQFVEGLDRDAFLQDAKTTDAVVRNLQVIGEAAARLPSEIKERHPDVPWGRIVGLRNRIVHAYFDVDLELVWNIVGQELPVLALALRAVHRQESGESA